jgi:hypothetical protein
VANVGNSFDVSVSEKQRSLRSILVEQVANVLKHREAKNDKNETKTEMSSVKTFSLVVVDLHEPIKLIQMMLMCLKL